MSSRRTVWPGDRPAGNPRGTRSPVLARHGMIATSQPLASAAGLHVLLEGGTAVDAAVAAAAVLSVVEPTMTGVGGDLFALVYDARARRLRGLNASGRTGRASTCEAVRRRGIDRLPSRGPLSVTVPGAVDGWFELLTTHGSMPPSRLLAPAVTCARDGFPVAEVVAAQWREAEPALAAEPDAAALFLPKGRAPRAGEIFRNEALAATLRQIAEGGRDAFYRGPLAATIAGRLQERGGLLDARDFACHRSNWVDPLQTTFRGCQVHELPPNTQGLVVLQMLNLLERFDLAALGHNSAATLHLLIEAKRLAFADRDAYLADPARVPPDRLQALISKEYAAERARAIDPERAAVRVEAGLGHRSVEGSAWRVPPSGAGDTVFLTAADDRGNVVALIQSLFESFGSGVVAGGTGVVLHSRGSLFSLDDAHPNGIGPDRRPMHTLIPAMVLRDGRPWLSMGVMGGDLQPQGHVQVLLNLLEFGMTVQEAADAARCRHAVSGVALESGIDAEARRGLVARGHVLVDEPGVFGGCQAILIDPDTGVMAAASDPRKDGLAIGY